MMNRYDKAIEIVVVSLSIMLGVGLIVSTVIPFLVDGRSPYMVLTVWYVAQTWYSMFGRNEE